MTPTTDVAIIGAGPIGLELAVALKRASVPTLHFDANQIAHTIARLFPPQTPFFSSNDRIAIAGVPLMTTDQNKATREEYLTYLRTIVQTFDLPIHTYEPVRSVTRIPAASSTGNWELGTGNHLFELQTSPPSGEKLYRAKSVVFCTGGTARPRLLNIPGEDLPHVSHYFTDPHAYFRKDVLIVGGKNSAVETALRCHNAGARVTLSYRRPAFNERSIKYWLLPEITGLIASGKITAHFSTHPTQITPTHTTLQHPDGHTTDVPADFVLLLTGYEADMHLLKTAGVHLHAPCDNPTYNPDTMETNIPHLYVAGTAVGGTQDKYSVFIENCHTHVDRIVQHLTGQHALVTQVDTQGREET